MKKLNKHQLEEINHLKDLPDEAINISDIPEQTNWNNAVVGRFFDKNKTSVEIDNEVLSWFKARSRSGYKRMINKALFDYIKDHGQ